MTPAEVMAKHPRVYLALERVEAPGGPVVVSTVRTPGGGAPEYTPPGSPFSNTDFEDLMTWPFETMVFRASGPPPGVEHDGKGVYHAPWGTEAQAHAGHVQTAADWATGRGRFGAGVRGPSGVPSITPDEWWASLSCVEGHP